MKKKRPPADEPLPDGTGRLGNNPFGALKGLFPGGDGSAAPPEAASAPIEPAPKARFAAKQRPPREQQPGATQPAPAAGRVIVRREKKGRGGKTMTRVSGLGLGAAELEDFARTMKRALGCGAVVEDEDVLVQGAQTERAATWLRAHGHADVRIGN